MKNRAKCKLCEEIIESFHRHDYVTCKCGEISVDGGSDYFRCAAKDWGNFLRIDDLGNVIVPTIKEQKEAASDDKPVQPLTKEELLKLLADYIKSSEEMPKEALSASVTHYDLLSFMYLVQVLFKASF